MMFFKTGNLMLNADHIIHIKLDGKTIVFTSQNGGSVIQMNDHYRDDVVALDAYEAISRVLLARP